MNDADQAVLLKPSVQNDEALVRQWLGSLEGRLSAIGARAQSQRFLHRTAIGVICWRSPGRSRLYRGADQIAAAMAKLQGVTQAHGFAIAKNRTAPRRVRRLGIDVIEALFDFETAIGRASGVLRLLADKPSQAWVLVDVTRGIERLRGTDRHAATDWYRVCAQLRRRQLAGRAHEAPGVPRPRADGARRRRRTGGFRHCGAARTVGRRSLLVDKQQRVGDNWRKRYHSSRCTTRSR